MDKSVIKASEVSVSRGNMVVLNRLTFNITPGKITGLIGPSGSGKTTLMRAIVGVQRVTAGSLTVLGMNAGAKRLRSHLSYMSQIPAIYGDLTVKQNLNYFSKILGKSDNDVKRVLHQVDLTGNVSQLVNKLSGGQQARVSLAIALIADARIMVLDEPTVGLDPVLRNQLWQLFKSLTEIGGSLLVSSHVMDEAEKCDDILLLRDGKLLNHSSKDKLLASTESHSVEAAFLKLVSNSEDRN
jgi:ABC-2 type transport system ATP-binding protein